MACSGTAVAFYVFIPFSASNVFSGYQAIIKAVVALMLGTEMSRETLVVVSELTQLMARDYFINISRREGIISYTFQCNLRLIDVFKYL
jgi:hypothetical protein